MDPNTNPLTNTNPAAGANPGVPPTTAPLQGAPQNIRSTIGTNTAASMVGLAQPQSPEMPQTSGTATASGIVSAANALPNTGVPSSINAAPGVGTSGAAPITADALTGSDIVIGNGDAPEDFGTTSVGSFGTTAAPVSSPNDMTSFGSADGGLSGEAAETPIASSKENTPMPPAMPIGRPTNIDGIKPVGVSEVAFNANDAVTESAVANPFSATNDRQTPSVSFTDPVMEPEKSQVSDGQIGAQNLKPQKKSNRTVLIILSVIAFVVAIALAVVLVMEVMGIGPFASSNNDSGQSSDQSQPNKDNNSDDGSGGGNDNEDDGDDEASDSGDSDDGLQASVGDIFCDVTSTEGDGGSQQMNVVIGIVDNKVTEIKAEAIAVDEEGNEQTFSMTLPAEGLTSISGTDIEQSEYLESDGTLKVSAQEFADYMETSMVESGYVGTCSVK